MIEEDRGTRVKAIFEAACSRPIDARAAFLAGECAGDEALRREVDALLEYDARGSGLLDAPLIDDRGRRLILDDSPTKLPEMIGRYRIVRLLGQGSTATVFEGEQEIPRRRVAVRAGPPPRPDDQAHHFLAGQALNRIGPGPKGGALGRSMLPPCNAQMRQARLAFVGCLVQRGRHRAAVAARSRGR